MRDRGHLSDAINPGTYALRQRRGQRHRPPIRSCSGRGLPCARHYCRTGGLLHRLFTLASRKEDRLAVCFCGTFHRRRYGSAVPALTAGRPALRSPDFPPPPHSREHQQRTNLADVMFPATQVKRERPPPFRQRTQILYHKLANLRQTSVLRKSPLYPQGA